MTTQFKDAAPVAVSGQVGSTMSLYDFLQQSYGGNIGSVQSVYVNVAAVYGSYWDPAAGHTADTRVVDAAGHDISAAGETVNAADFKNVQIVIGNNINSNVFVTVPETNTWDTTRSFAVTALPQQLDANPPAGHVPTAADIVSAATALVNAENATAQSEHLTTIANVNDCHGIASAIAASAGATLGQVTGNTENLATNPNEASGFWRIAYTDGSAGADWQSKVQAGDIVRMERTDGGVHTITVVAGLNADGQHPGQIETVDNWNGIISQHWSNYNDGSAHDTTVASSVTVYRLATDGQYLIDQSSDTHNTTIVGDNFNDLIKVGSGSDTVNGGAGTDTAVLSGNKADYQIVNGADGSVSVTGHGVTDKLVSIEKIQFNDQTVDLTAQAGPAPEPAPAPVAGSVAIGDATITEGNNGSQVETFTVTRTGGSAALDVHFATADGSATTADNDYAAKSGNVHFDAGVNTQMISVTVNGDTKVEGNETFNVNLSGATNGATIAHAQGVGTIVNDDAAPVAGSVAINDVSITEGDNGSKIETFTVTRSGGNAAFDVNFATADGSATTADKDYVAKSGSVHFDAGVNTQTISVSVNGDSKVEGNETFNVNLSGATDGATIAHGQGIGTIVNDDAAAPAPVSGSIAISDVSISEGDNGSKVETFTVTRSGGSAAFDAHFATADGSATTADHDYVAKSGDLHFDAGVNTQTISVTVNGDTKVEGNETFNVNLSAATNGATISHAQGVGTIINDDTASSASHVTHTSGDFNGDGMSDILFRNTHTGSVALWELNGNHVDSNTTVGSAGLNWHADGIGDFNGDGKADVLWVSNSGQVATWQMNGDHVDANQTIGSIGSGWHVAEVADFNGDGKSDILWQNDSGKVALWEMDGNHVVSNTTVGTIGGGWHAAAAADFNGDGKADILWQNDNGKVATWQMDGDHVTSNTTVASVGSNWHVAGADDFNGDGKADVLWQNDKGQVAMWQMNGDHVAANTTVGTAAGWTVAGTGDVNHDGKADILLQNAAGHVAEWQMNGDHIAQNLTVGSVSSDWHMV